MDDPTYSPFGRGDKRTTQITEEDETLFMREELRQEYNEARRSPLAFSGPMRRCPDPNCNVRRNQWHTDDCERVRNMDAPEKRKLVKAANELEDLAMIAKIMVTDLREGKDNPYARVYWLRKQLGYIVASLGVGVPKGLTEIEQEYEKQLPLPY